VKPDNVKPDNVSPANERPTGARGGRPRLGGHGSLPMKRDSASNVNRGGASNVKRDAVPNSAAATPATARKRVLFVCIGNSCRSQMAEAFARVYGRDVMDPHSAGVAPSSIIAPMTKQVLGEKNLTVGDQFPKGLDMMARVPFDIVVNMSGAKISLPNARMIEWPVVDPIGQKDEVYRAVAEKIEGLVMRLVIELRGELRGEFHGDLRNAPR